MTQVISVQDLLTQHGIAYREANGEIITNCLFNGCDSDSRPGEAHLYIDPVTGLYQCKKCGSKGNLTTLDQYLGRKSSDSDPAQAGPTAVEKEQAKFQAALPARIVDYLVGRGITPKTICTYGVGYCTRKDGNWITIPIPAKDGTLLYHKLRQDPAQGDNKTTSKKGVNAQLYGWDVLAAKPPYIFICEGEPDRLAFISRGIAAVTSTHGVGTFNIDWLDGLDKSTPVYVGFDHDTAGQQGCERLLEKLHKAGFTTLFWVHLPDAVGDKGDVTDYLVKIGGKVEALFAELAEPFPPRYNSALFKPITGADICRILEPVIKGDDENKLTVILAGVSTYCADGQMNVCMVGRSSGGKTHITQHVLALFPPSDVQAIGSMSPTALFHDNTGEYDRETNTIKKEFDGKILAFFDQPDPALLSKMRPVLSHDAPMIRASITDRSEKGGHRTKHIEFHGHPAVIFCTTASNFDEQEATRAILLSPRLTQEKLKKAVEQAIARHGDSVKFDQAVDADPDRLLLKNRIAAIKYDGERRVTVPDELHGQVKSHLGSDGNFQARSARDASRLMSIIKCFALLNKWYRPRQDGAIVAAQDDFEEAIRLWAKLRPAQDQSIPPNVLETLVDVIGPLHIERLGATPPGTGQIGLSYEEILARYSVVNGNEAGPDLVRSAVPLLCHHNLVVYEKDPNDRRRNLVRLTDKGLALVERHQERE